MVRGPLLVAALSSCATLHVRPSVASSSFCDAGEDWRSIWADEFDGDLIDASKWTITVGTWPAASSSPAAAAASHALHSREWGAAAAPHAAATAATTAGLGADCHGDGCVILGSCRSAACTADNAYLENGTLVLRSQRQEAQGLNFTTGAVNTRHKSTWTASPGAFRLCVSAKLPGGGGDQSGRGIWPAHWLMPDDDTCDPDEGEIDIMEMVDGAGTVCVVVLVVVVAAAAAVMVAVMSKRLLRAPARERSWHACVARARFDTAASRYWCAAGAAAAAAVECHTDPPPRASRPPPPPAIHLQLRNVPLADEFPRDKLLLPEEPLLHIGQRGFVRCVHKHFISAAFVHSYVLIN
jgi:hypothetical protein